jgi:hypothetical protein
VKKVAVVVSADAGKFIALTAARKTPWSRDFSRKLQVMTNRKIDKRKENIRTRHRGTGFTEKSKQILTSGSSVPLW